MSLSLVVNGSVILYNERPGSPHEMYSQGAFRVQRIFDCAWKDRWALVLGLLGDAKVINPGGGGSPYIQRSTPQGYVTNVGGADAKDQWMFPTSVDSMEPIGADTGVDADGVSQYNICRLTVSYEGTHYKVLSDAEMQAKSYTAGGKQTGAPDESTLGRYVTIFKQPTAEYFALPFGALKWVEINDDNNWDAANGRFFDTHTTGPNGPFAPNDRKEYPGAQVIGSYGKIIGASEVQIIWHMVPKVPTALDDAQGTLNQAVFKDPDDRINAPIGTLLLTNAEVKPYRWIGGKYLFDISYKMKYFNPEKTQGAGDPDQITHNHFLHYRPGPDGFNLPPTYRQLTNDGKSTGYGVYRYSDFTELFKPI